MKTTLLLLLLLVPCAAANVAAQEETGNPENWCRNGLFPGDGKDFKAARVVAERGARVYFYGDDEQCPKVGAAKCRLKSYLIAGDEVIVSRAFGDWLCAWFQPKRGGETVGWLRAESLSVAEPDSKPPPARWVGEWEYDIQSLKIGASGGGALRVEGQAFWRGLGDNIHTGEVAGTARPSGNELVLEDDICRVTLKLVGEYLVAHDNANCGGVNVRFDGVYRRKQARRGPPGKPVRRANR